MPQNLININPAGAEMLVIKKRVSINFIIHSPYPSSPIKLPNNWSNQVFTIQHYRNSSPEVLRRWFVFVGMRPSRWLDQR